MGELNRLKLPHAKAECVQLFLYEGSLRHRDE